MFQKQIQRLNERDVCRRVVVKDYTVDEFYTETLCCQVIIISLKIKVNEKLSYENVDRHCDGETGVPTLVEDRVKRGTVKL